MCQSKSKKTKVIALYGKVSYDRLGYIINRIRDDKELAKMKLPDDMEFLGFIPEDETIRNSDIEGKSFLEMSDCAAIDSIRKCLDTMDIFKLDFPVLS